MNHNSSGVAPGVSLSAALFSVLMFGNAALVTSAFKAPAPQFERDWRLGPAVTYDNLTIFPVISSNEADTSEFATLDDALASGAATIAEQGNYVRRSRDVVAAPQFNRAQVNQLVLVNRGKKPLLLLAGEVVSGGKQDRIIGKDRIVPVGAAPLPLDVFCVEHGRWTDGVDRFSAAQMMVHPSVREKAAVEQDQSQVWAAVRSGSTSDQLDVSGGLTGNAPAAAPRISAGAVAQAIESSAPTESYRKIYKSSPVGASVESFAEEMERRFRRATTGLKGQRVVGVVVAYGDEVAWSDVFASSQLFDSYWPKLLRSYVVEALARPARIEKVSTEDARDFLRPASGHIHEESEPGVYLWREQSEGREAAIELESLDPKPMTLHWLKVLRTN